MSELILPGSTIGILGDGQLGRMLAIAARQLGYRVRVFGDDINSPAAQMADEAHVVSLAVDEPWECLLDSVHVLTYETENLPLGVLQHIAQYVLVRPGLSLLEMSQNRLLEKQALRNAGLPVPDFVPIGSTADLVTGVEQFQYRCVLKTTTGGYDGKGQWLLRSKSDLPEALSALENQLRASPSTSSTAASAAAAMSSSTPEADRMSMPRTAPLILERLIDFEWEFSVVAACSASGQFASYGPLLNLHRDHILDVTMCPAPFADSIDEQAIEIMRQISKDLQVVGLFCVEFFLTHDGAILINEIAPRTHNSGHLTMESHDTSQFSQQLRAICGLPLGSTRQHTPAAMVNLLGDIWSQGEPNWHEVLSVPTGHLHLYGKKNPRPQRKMGHFTVLDPRDAATAAEIARAARMRLSRFSGPDRENGAT